MEPQNDQLKNEIKHLRGYFKRVFQDPTNPKNHIARLYQTPIFYENKLSLGDGVPGFREIDATLHWDEQKQAWTFQYNNYHPTIPLFADQKMEFRDLFHDKDITIGLTPKAAHVQGRLVEPFEGTNGYQAVIYDDAFGPGQDLIIHPTATGLRKLVRLRSYDRTKDHSFDFEMDLPADQEASVARSKKEHREKRGTNAKREKPTDLNNGKKLIIGNEEGKNPRRENHTYLRPVQIWDSGQIIGPNTGTKRENAHAQILTEAGKKILRKTIPAAFLADAVGPVFTDATVSIAETQDTYYGSVYETGGAPNADNLKVGGWSDWYYSFIKWDLTSAPRDEKTIWARIGLKVYSIATNNPAPLFYIITSAWNEADPTNATPPSYTTSYGMYITSPLTVGVGNWDIKEMTHIYRLWLNGTYTNYGLKIHPTNNVDAVCSYYSSDHATEANRPYLEVGYVADTDKQTRQLIPGGLPNSNLNNAASAYAAIAGHGSSESWTTTWHWRRALCAVDGAVRRIYFKLGAQPGTSKNYKFTLYRNGAAIWSSTYSGTQTEGYFDYGLNVFAGDDLILGCTPTGTPTATTLLWGIEFWSADEKYAVMAGSGAAPAVDGTVNYNNAAIGGTWFPTSNYTIENIIPHAATLRRFMVKLSTAPGAGKSWTWRALVGGVEVASVVIADTNLTGDSGDLNIDLVAGAHLMISIQGSGTPSTSSFMGWGFAIEPDEPGEFAIMGSTANAFDATQVTYNRINASYASAETTTRANVQRMITFGAQVPAVKIKRLVARVSVAPGEGNSWTIGVEKNGADTGLEAVIAGTNLFAWDTTHEANLAAQDLLNIKITPSGSPGTPTGRWSFVGYIAPTTDVQKTLAYEIKTHAEIAKGLLYAVRAPQELTKTAAYAVKTTPADLEKALAYTIKTTPGEITKAQTYAIRQPEAIEKSLAYEIRTEQAIDKALAYAIKAAGELQKGLAYKVVAPTSLTKNAAYAVIKPRIIEKPAAYAVLNPNAITKALAYTVRAAQELTKATAYTVRAPQAIDKALAYQIRTGSDITKALAYEMRLEQTITIDKALAYSLRMPQDVTKALQYVIKATQGIEKALGYEILTTAAITKATAYRIRTITDATKALTYAIKAAEEITKPTAYTIKTTDGITKTLAYKIRTEHELTKGLQFKVGQIVDLTKTLGYKIRRESGITKAAAYLLRLNPYQDKASPYTKKTGIYSAKSKPYHKFPAN